MENKILAPVAAVLLAALVYTGFNFYQPVTSAKAVAEMSPAAQKPPAAQQLALNDTQKKEMGEFIRSYLLNNPEIIRDAIGELEKRETAARDDLQSRAVTDNAQTLFRSAMSPIGGNPKGDVTVVEFFDYNCPYCRRAFKDLVKLMDADSKVKIVFKEFPIFGGASLVAAKAALAAEKQNKYFEFHKALLEQQGRISETTVFRIASDLKLDVDKLKKDMESADIAAEIKQVSDDANKLGIRGTPAFLVGENLIPGAPDDLLSLMKSHVADLRKNGCKVC